MFFAAAASAAAFAASAFAAASAAFSAGFSYDCILPGSIVFNASVAAFALATLTSTSIERPLGTWLTSSIRPLSVGRKNVKWLWYSAHWMQNDFNEVNSNFCSFSVEAKKPFDSRGSCYGNVVGQIKIEYWIFS